MTAVTLTADIRDVTGVADNSTWRFTSVLRESTTPFAIVSTRKVRVKPVSGVLTVELEPGPAVAEFAGRAYAFTVPDEDAQLWPLIEAAVAVPPGTAAQVLAVAIESYLAQNPTLAAVIESYLAENPTPSIDGGTP